MQRNDKREVERTFKDIVSSHEAALRDALINLLNRTDPSDDSIYDDYVVDGDAIETIARGLWNLSIYNGAANRQVLERSDVIKIYQIINENYKIIQSPLGELVVGREAEYLKKFADVLDKYKDFISIHISNSEKAYQELYGPLLKKLNLNYFIAKPIFKTLYFFSEVSYLKSYETLNAYVQSAETSTRRLSDDLIAFNQFLDETLKQLNALISEKEQKVDVLIAPSEDNTLEATRQLIQNQRSQKKGLEKAINEFKSQAKSIQKDLDANGASQWYEQANMYSYFMTGLVFDESLQALQVEEQQLKSRLATIKSKLSNQSEVFKKLDLEMQKNIRQEFKQEIKLKSVAYLDQHADKQAVRKGKAEYWKGNIEQYIQRRNEQYEWLDDLDKLFCTIFKVFGAVTERSKREQQVKVIETALGVYIQLGDEVLLKNALKSGICQFKPRTEDTGSKEYLKTFRSVLQGIESGLEVKIK